MLSLTERRSGLIEVSWQENESGGMILGQGLCKNQVDCFFFLYGQNPVACLSSFVFLLCIVLPFFYLPILFPSPTSYHSTPPSSHSSLSPANLYSVYNIEECTVMLHIGYHICMCGYKSWNWCVVVCWNIFVQWLISYTLSWPFILHRKFGFDYTLAICSVLNFNA